MSAGPRKRITALEVALLTILITLLIATLAFVIVYGPQVTGRAPAKARTAAEIKGLTVAIEAYAIDHGTVPRNADTDALDPVTDVIASGSAPSASRYARASKHLYRELTGDQEPAEAPDGVPEIDHKSYYTFDRSMISALRNSSGTITKVRYIQDPFGICYGYSTAGLASSTANKNGGSTSANNNSVAARGYNKTTFDLWSTTGDRQGRWIKNWP